MLRRLNPQFQRAALTGLICFAVLVAGCTRSATTAVVPTAGPTDIISSTQGVTQPSDQDATMNAVSTQVSGSLTQTAVATAGGGGQQQTPGAPSSGTPQQPGPTDTPSGYPAQPGQPTDTQAAPGATQPSQPADTATPVPPPAGAPCPNPYTVQQGDWIYKIARNCGVSVAALIAANPNINPDAISPGQLLNMPGPGSTPAGADPQPAGCSGQHTVSTGDTLYRIAYTCGLTVEQLAAANNIVYPYTIYIGQVLNIP